MLEYIQRSLFLVYHPEKAIFESEPVPRVVAQWTGFLFGGNMSLTIILEKKKMDSREISDLTGKAHDKVTLDIETQLGAIGDVAIFRDIYFDSMNRKRVYYRLPYRETMILVSGYSVELRAKVIDRWMDLEREDRENLPDFSNPAEAARAWASEYEAKQLAEKALIEAAPKIAFFDQVADSKDAFQMRDVAAVLNIKGMGRNKIFQKLRDEKILDDNNTPYREYQDRGYFRVIERSWTTPDGEVHINKTTLVYQKGADYIRKAMVK